MTRKKNNEKIESIDLDNADIIINDISGEPRFKTITNNYINIFKEKKITSSKEDILNDYTAFLYETISSKFNNQSVLTSADLKKMRETSRVNVWKHKQRLCKSSINSLEKQSNKFLHKEYIKVCEEFSKYKEEISQKITELSEEEKKQLYIKKPENIIKEKIDFLNRWSSSVDFNITDFPYLGELSDKKIQAAFTHDIIFCVTELLRCQYDYDIKKMVVETPVGVAPGLFIPHKRGRKPNTLAVTKRGDSIASKYYDTKDLDGNKVDTFYEFSMEKAQQQILNGDENFETLKLELINPETEKKALRQLYLDEQDLSIMRFVYTYSYKNQVPFYISDLLKYLQISDSKRNYQRIEDKLIKLPCYNFYTEKYDEITKSKKRSNFNLFSRVDIETDVETNRRIAKVTKAFVEEVEVVSTELMYKRELNKLTLEQSKNLAYFLEGRRSFEISNGINIKDKKYTYTIDYLKWYVHLDNKKSLKNNMLFLEEGFKEIMKNQFIIKKYQMNQSSFDVWFYEGFEKRKELLKNTILALEESNGNIIEI